MLCGLLWLVPLWMRVELPFATSVEGTRRLEVTEVGIKLITSGVCGGELGAGGVARSSPRRDCAPAVRPICGSRRRRSPTAA